jgi:hypothetical protein
MSAKFNAQKKNIQFRDRIIPEKSNGRKGFTLNSSLNEVFFMEYIKMKGNANNTLKNTKTGEGKAAQIENKGIDPQINVAKNISNNPLFLLFTTVLPPI